MPDHVPAAPWPSFTASISPAFGVEILPQVAFLLQAGGCDPVDYGRPRAPGGLRPAVVIEVEPELSREAFVGLLRLMVADLERPVGCPPLASITLSAEEALAFEATIGPAATASDKAAFPRLFKQFAMRLASAIAQGQALRDVASKQRAKRGAPEPASAAEYLGLLAGTWPPSGAA